METTASGGVREPTGSCGSAPGGRLDSPAGFSDVKASRGRSYRDADGSDADRQLHERARPVCRRQAASDALLLDAGTTRNMIHPQAGSAA